MPELPEVETVKNSLKPLVINKTITKVDVFYDKIIKNINPKEFCQVLCGQKIIDIKRLGKYLIFVLSDFYLISHLRMEGKYYIGNDNIFNKHEHIIFYFENENLRYQDTRKFGTMYLYPLEEDIYNLNPLNKVGYEPFDERLTSEYLYKHLSKSNRPIKTSLLDQQIISGLGNIYVDEVLFMVKINPLTPSKDLSVEDCQNVIEASKKVLNKAIKLGGTTIRSFTVNHVISGRFQNELLIHTKDECPECHQKVDKIYVGGRGTYYCHNCQSMR